MAAFCLGATGFLSGSHDAVAQAAETIFRRGDSSKKQSGIEQAAQQSISEERNGGDVTARQPGGRPRIQMIDRPDAEVGYREKQNRARYCCARNSPRGAATADPETEANNERETAVNHRRDRVESDEIGRAHV